MRTLVLSVIVGLIGFRLGAKYEVRQTNRVIAKLGTQEVAAFHQKRAIEGCEEIARQCMYEAHSANVAYNACLNKLKEVMGD
jgi:hypothetical protein